MKKTLWTLVSCFLAVAFFCRCSEQRGAQGSISANTMDSVSTFRNVLLGIDSSLALKNGTYIAIPLNGCASCVDPAFAFLLKNYTNEDFVFIITEINSPKVLMAKLGDDIISEGHIRLDHNNYVTRNFYSIYPQVFVIRDKKMTGYRQVDSQSVSFWDTLTN